MKLRKLIIKNLRGIREMEWDLSGDMACLIGPGDSTKSTILLALEYLFSGNWSLSVSDVDFHQMNVQNPIEIVAIVAELPDVLITEGKFGLYLGFWNPQDKKLYEEQKDGLYQKALQIRLEIPQDLEPKWTVVSLQTEGREPQPISAADRRALGVAKIGNYVAADLAWGRNSALSRLTQKEDISRIPTMLAQAERNILNALKDMDFSALSQAIEEAKLMAQTLGIDAQTELRTGMDPMRVSLRQGAIALFDGDLPFSLRGAGGRRLMAMAIHKAAVKEGAIILIDEIENSLEPYRLRHLIRQLRPKDGEKHQVIFTTHSSVTVVECQASELYVAHSENGKTAIAPVDQDFQAVVRSIPEAFLSRKIIVCEGKTEAGFLISLDKNYWQEQHRSDPSQHRYQTMAEAGVVPIESPRSGGSEAPKHAATLAKLGFRVAYFGDSDRDLSPSEEEMRQAGVEEVFLWDKAVEIERRLCLDLPLNALKELVDLAVKLTGSEQSVWDKIHGELPEGAPRTQNRSFETLESEIGASALRACIGLAADRGGWFKRRDKGERLGELVSHSLDKMLETSTMITLRALEQWCYE